MLIIFHKGYDVADIFFVTYFFVLCILVDAGFILATDWLQLKSRNFMRHSDELKLEIAAEGECYE
jgi:hypothetical protein